MVKGDTNDIYIFQRRSRGKANSWQLLLLRSAANVFSVCLLYCEIHRSEKHRFLRPLLEVTSVGQGKIFRDNDVSGMQVCRHPVCFILLTVLWRAAGARFRKERARLPLSHRVPSNVVTYRCVNDCYHYTSTNFASTFLQRYFLNSNMISKQKHYSQPCRLIVN